MDKELVSGKSIRIKSRYAYVGEKGKFCGYYLNVGMGLERRRCGTEEFCGTGFGGAYFKNYTCIKLSHDMIN